jgi:hypothetical protein
LWYRATRYCDVVLTFESVFNDISSDRLTGT